jgi:hypothetical protein
VNRLDQGQNRANASCRSCRETNSRLRSSPRQNGPSRGRTILGIGWCVAGNDASSVRCRGFLPCSMSAIGKET